jgi:hypothetical protein
MPRGAAVSAVSAATDSDGTRHRQRLCRTSGLVPSCFRRAMFRQAVFADLHSEAIARICTLPGDGDAPGGSETTHARFRHVKPGHRSIGAVRAWWRWVGILPLSPVIANVGAIANFV